MSVVLSTEDSGPCQKTVTVEVPKPAVDAEVQRVVREFSRQVRLPGFRKGKTPASLIRKRFKADIDKEVLERLLPRYWKQAQAEQDFEPLLQPTVEQTELVDGEPLVFKATIDVRPEIEVSDDRDFDLPDQDVLVGEAEVDEFVGRLREQQADWKAVERAAARGDQVALKIRETTPDSDDEEDSEESEGSESAEPDWQDLTVEVGQEGLWEELSLAVTGLEAGQSGRFDRKEIVAPAATQEPSDDAATTEASQEPTEKTRSFELEIVEVREKDLPELDDEQSQALGFGTVEELREKVHDSLLHEKQHERSRERESKMLDQLIERHPMALPERVVEAERQEMLREYATSLQRNGVDIQAAQIDWQDVMQKMQPQAERRIHARLVIDAIASHDGIEVSEEELEKALAQIAQSEKQSTVAVRQALDRDGRLQELRRQLRREKTVRILLGEDPEGDGHDHHHHDADHDDSETSESATGDESE